MKETSSQEDAIRQIQEMLEKRGRKALEMARTTVLEEKIESEEVQEALKYFITECTGTMYLGLHLLSIVCEAVGGDPNATTPIAIPMSLISGAVDIHDDIIDQSKCKGSRQTVFGKFGKDLALLVGDALLFKGFNLLQQAGEKGVSAEKVKTISEIIKKTFFELGDAEALELRFRERTDVTPEEYLRVVKKKAADVEAHTRIGAILGNGTKEEIEALSEYGRHLGILIILRDDMIDTMDTEETLHRIKKEHISLPVLYALQNSKTQHTLSYICNKKKILENDYEKIISLVVEAAGLDLVDNYMQKIAQKSFKLINTVKNNKNLLLLIKGMTLPEWRDFLGPPKSNG